MQFFVMLPKKKIGKGVETTGDRPAAGIKKPLSGQERERNALGKELHDNISQILATAKIYLGMAKRRKMFAG